MSVPPDRLAGLSPGKRALLAQRLRQKPGAPLAPLTPTVERIAILASACRLPGGADSPATLWQLLAEGRDAVTDVPASRWDGAALFSHDPHEANRIQSRCGGFLDGLDRFDAAFFGIAPREAALMDPQQRLLLELAWEALEAAGLPIEGLARSATGVFVGAHSQSSDWWLLQLAQRGGVASHSSTGSAHSILANRVSYAYDLRGPSMTVDTACSSSLVAIHLACQSLRSGECDLALAGGVNLMLLPSASFAFSQLQILSAGGRCRTFDAAADGIVRGEGCALVVLKRLSEALRDGDPILAVIAGSAVNQDGASNGLTAPNGPAQEAVIQRALAMAAMAPERVGLVETHGTGTPLGDPVEVEALAHVIGPARDAAHRCWLGALKTNIGHLEAAAGVAGLIKAVECLRRGLVPANLHFTRPNPYLRLDGTPFVIPLDLTPWPAGTLPRVAGVSSFGFGGTNAHIVLEEHRGETPAVVDTSPRDQLLTVSARNPAALVQSLREHATALDTLPAEQLGTFVYTAKVRRSHHAHRIAVVGSAPQALAERLRARLADAAKSPAVGDTRPVWVYTGQGSLWPGMGRELFDTEPVFRTALEEVAALFESAAGWNLLPVVIDASESTRHAATEVAQPALFALQVGLTALWRAWGMPAGAVVGHSVGEVAAALAAGVLTLDDAVVVVLQRSRAMQPTFGHGCMAQAECGEADLRAELAAFGDVLAVAALNGPASTVLSGPTEPLNACVAQLQARGIATRALAVDYAFHSNQMTHVVPSIVAALRTIRPRPATLPFMSTVTGRWAESGNLDAAYWGRNVRDTVRFAPAVQELLAAGYRTFLEIGPHPALGASIQAQADAARTEVGIAASLRRDKPARAALLSSMGALLEAGTAIDWQRHRDPRRRVLTLPRQPWQRQRHWLAAPDVAALAFSVTGRAGPAAALSDPTACYEMSWLPSAVLPRAPAFDITRHAAPLEALAATWPEAQVLAGESDVQTALEAHAAAHVWHTLGALGLDSAGMRITPETAAKRGILVRHTRLWGRMLQMAGQAGFLFHDGDDWIVTARSVALHDDVVPAPQRLERALLDRCGVGLAAVLRGTLDPLALLFPPDGGDSAAQIYAQSDSARVYNRLAAAAIARLAREMPRPLRIVEIGAGTGATMSALIPVLPAGSHYCFTDVSPLFLHEAAARLAGTPLDLRFSRLDIERAPQAQGFTPGEFDVVVAANVLHATSDLRRTLDHVRSLLAPGGVLVMIETVARRAWIDLTFGMTEGWWLFDDAPLRQDHALLNVETWRALLTAAGFDDTHALGAAFSQRAVHPQALLLARAAPTDTTARQRFVGSSWWLVGDRSGIASQLAEAICAEGGVCECVDAGDSRLPDESVHGIVYCAALDAPADAASPDAITPAFAWARRLQAGGRARLWLATRAAQRAATTDKVFAPQQAPLWGLGRSIALEHPTNWGGLVDLDPSATDAQSVSALLDTLAAGDGEDQVAIRNNVRHVARLAPRALPAPAALTLDAHGAYLVTGAYGGLGPKIIAWLADQGARTLVLIGRRGAAGGALAVSIENLRTRGLSIIAETADVADSAVMGRLFERLRADGTPVRGVVHAAAAIRFTALQDLTSTDLADALRAKVQGSQVLHELTRDLPLDLFVLFSSATTLFGAKGLAAYAAANQFLGLLAWQRAALSLPATCVDWGAWSEIRLLDGQRSSNLEQLGFRSMSDATALAILSGLVHGRVPQCLVADVDWQTASAAYQAQGRRPFLDNVIASAPERRDEAAPLASAADLRAELIGLPESARHERIGTVVRDELAGVLGLAGSRDVDPAKGFFELGLDSLMAMQLRRRLAARLNLTLPASVTFNHPSAAPLARHLLGLLALTPDTAQPIAAAGASEAACNDIADLTDAEVRSALITELAEFRDLGDRPDTAGGGRQ